jgi:hypothetical protein
VLAAKGVLLPLNGSLHRQLVDVCAGNERFLARTGQDDRAHVRVMLERQHGTAQLVQRLGVERVEHLGTVDGEHRNGAVPIEKQILKAHAQ